MPSSMTSARQDLILAQLQTPKLGNRHHHLQTPESSIVMPVIWEIGDRGLGFMVRDSLGDVLAGTYQSVGFLGPNVAEAEPCLFGLRQALLVGFTNLVIEDESF